MMSISTNWNPTEPRPIVEVSVSLSINELRGVLPLKLTFTTESLLEQLLLTQYFKRDIFEQIGTLVARGQDPKTRLAFSMDVSMIFVLRQYLRAKEMDYGELQFYAGITFALITQTNYLSSINDNSNEKED